MGGLIRTPADSVNIIPTKLALFENATKNDLETRSCCYLVIFLTVHVLLECYLFLLDF